MFFRKSSQPARRTPRTGPALPGTLRSEFDQQTDEPGSTAHPDNQQHPDPDTGQHTTARGTAAPAEVPAVDVPAAGPGHETTRGRSYDEVFDDELTHLLHTPGWADTCDRADLSGESGGGLDDFVPAPRAGVDAEPEQAPVARADRAEPDEYAQFFNTDRDARPVTEHRPEDTGENPPAVGEHRH